MQVQSAVGFTGLHLQELLGLSRVCIPQALLHQLACICQLAQDLVVKTTQQLLAFLSALCSIPVLKTPDKYSGHRPVHTEVQTAICS